MWPGTRHRVAVDSLELDRVQPSSNGGARMHHFARGIHHERIAVEHQFVLAAEHVHVHDRQAEILRRSAAHDVFAIALLVELVRRGIEHHEQSRRPPFARSCAGSGSQMSSHTSKPMRKPRQLHDRGLCRPG